MDQIEYSWLKYDNSTEMFFEHYCNDCGNTYTTDDIMSKCPVCGGNE